MTDGDLHAHQRNLEYEASLRREDDREWEREREQRTAGHYPKRSSVDLQGFMQAVSEADAGGRASD